MRTTTTVIVGAGQAGLAMSRCLTDRSIDHVLLERGDVANSWSTGRWDSLRLLTPNWQSRLPGHRYTGPDPDGFMTMPQLVGYLRGYAAAIDAPVETNTEVTSVRAARRRLRRHDHRGRVALPEPSCWPTAPAACPTSRRWRPISRPRSDRWRRPSTATRPARARRRPDRRGVGHRHPAGRRDPPLRPAGHPRRRRPRPGAAHLPGHGHHVVARRRRDPRRALRRGRRRQPGAQPAVVPARRLADPGDDRPQHPPGERRPDRRPPRRRARRHRAALGLAAEPVQARRPQARPAARRDRRVGHGPGLDGEVEAPAPARADLRRAEPAARPPARHRRHQDRRSGRPATDPTSPGSTCRCSTTRAASSTTAA